MPPTDTPESLSGQTPHPCRPHARGRPSPPRGHLRLRLPADTVAPSLARAQLREWLAALRWPEDETFDIVMAASEAVSNSGEHGFVGGAAGFVDLEATLETRPDGRRRIIVVVTDGGSWRPAPADDENRRRGLPLMRAVMDTVTIEVTNRSEGQPSATRVTLTSPLVPPPQV